MHTVLPRPGCIPERADGTTLEGEKKYDDDRPNHTDTSGNDDCPTESGADGEYLIVEAQYTQLSSCVYEGCKILYNVDSLWNS